MTTNRKLPMLLALLLLRACIFVPMSQAEEGACPVPTMTATFNYPSSWGCEWFTGNPDEIARNQNGVIELRNGRPPYQWQISGTGFWFDAAHTITSVQTTDPAIRVYVGSSACGSAAINVTDGSACSQNGTVRTSAGRWVKVSNNQCVMSGAWNYRYSNYYGLIRGGKNQEVAVLNTYLYSRSLPDDHSCSNPAPGANCLDRCQLPNTCIQNGVGCQDCLQTGLVPCVNESDPQHTVYRCYCVTIINYYEWRCN